MVEPLTVVYGAKEAYLPFQQSVSGGRTTHALAEGQRSGVQVHLKRSERLREYLAECTALRHLGGWPAVRLLDESDAQNVLVLERVNGTDLGRVLDEGRFQDPALNLYLIGYIAGMLAELEKGETYQGDVKPGNVLMPFEVLTALRQGTLEQTVANRGLVLCDFEFARRGGQGRMEFWPGGINDIIGTPKYMSPESVEGHYSRKSDVYSFGMSVWEMVEPRPVFIRETAIEILFTLSRELKNRPPRFTAQLYGAERVIQATLEGKPENRPSAQEIVSEVAPILKDKAQIDLEEAVAVARSRR